MPRDLRVIRRYCRTDPVMLAVTQAYRMRRKMKYVSNWFACSECSEPTQYKRTADDGYHMGYCKQCKKVVRLRIDSEASTAS